MRLLTSYKAQLVPNQKSKSSTTVKISQVKKFVSDIKVGDVVLSLSDDYIIAGTVSSEAYIDDDIIIVRDLDGSAIGDNLDFKLRRKVQWTKKQNKKSLPYEIQKSLRANQTVFSIKDHWKAINHWLNVLFVNEGSLYFSSRIEQPENINNFDVTQYSMTLNRIEAYSLALSNLFEGDNFNSIDNNVDVNNLIKSSFETMCRERSFKLTTKQSFMSEGDFWGGITCGRIQKLIFVAIFASVMDVNVAFATEDVELLAQVQDMVTLGADQIKNLAQFDQVAESLKLKIPDASNVGQIIPLNDNDFPSDAPASFVAQ